MTNLFLGTSQILLGLENEYDSLHLHILEELHHGPGIPTWELETSLISFSAMNIWCMYKQLLSLLMFIKRKEWGSVSWRSMGHQGALKKETMAEEMAVFCTHYVFVNNEFRNFGDFEWKCCRFQSCFYRCLGGTCIVPLHLDAHLKTTSQHPTYFPQSSYEDNKISVITFTGKKSCGIA